MTDRRRTFAAPDPEAISWQELPASAKRDLVEIGVRLAFGRTEAEVAAELGVSRSNVAQQVRSLKAAIVAAAE